MVLGERKNTELSNHEICLRPLYIIARAGSEFFSHEKERRIVKGANYKGPYSCVGESGAAKLIQMYACYS